MSYAATTQWGQIYTGDSGMSYPAESVIRIFKGSFPRLRMRKAKAGDRVLDVGCGDGRHFPLFDALGLAAYGTEISREIVAALGKNLQRLGVRYAGLEPGTNASLPFADGSFEYVLSWNSCYYMTADQLDFPANVDEMARVLAPRGWLVCSVPKRSCFIFEGSDAHEKAGYRIIRNDPFGVRNGEVMRCFDDVAELERAFGHRFGNFCHADLHMDFFGYAYHWHVFVAERLGA